MSEALGGLAQGMAEQFSDGHCAGGAGKLDRERPSFCIGKQDALALDPVPFERDNFADASVGEHQQVDDGNDLVR